MSQPKMDQKLQEAVHFIQKQSSLEPKIGLVLGSGLGSIAQEMTDSITIPYSQIPYFHKTAVEGHAGQMRIGKLNGTSAVLLEGRFHYYEGHSMSEVVFPTRTLCTLGIHTLILTNAAGGINTRFRPGDIMLIEDHLNLMGDNPLKGPNLAELGPRFPDLTEAYSTPCLEVMRSTAHRLNISVQAGVYAGLSGPTYETPAEVKMLRTLGADAVGMSTVPETIAAIHMGIKVAGVSCITNLAAGLSSHKLSHQEVMDTSRHAADRIRNLLVAAVPQLSNLGKA
jgi:purine-nucleoside phosphorylase